MRNWPVIRCMLTILGSGVSMVVFASVMTLTNNTSHTARVEGLVNATASKQILPANGGASVIRSKGDFAGHVLLTSADKGLVGNVVFKQVNQQTQAADMNNVALVAVSGDDLTLNQPNA